MTFGSSDKKGAILHFTQLQLQQLFLLISNQYSPNYDFQKNVAQLFPKIATII